MVSQDNHIAAEASRPWIIYALSDPRTPDAVRYVGVTHQKPSERLRVHVRRSILGAMSHANSWIRSLLAKAFEPKLTVVYESIGPHWGAVERWWIAWHRDRGFRLTNQTDGGEGTIGLTRVKKAGVRWGSPPKYTEENLRLATEAMRNGMRPTVAAKTFNVSKSTAINVAKRNGFSFTARVNHKRKYTDADLLAATRTLLAGAWLHETSTKFGVPPAVLRMVSRANGFTRSEKPITDAMRLALASVRDGMPVQVASKKFSVARTTLTRLIKKDTTRRRAT